MICIIVWQWKSDVAIEMALAVKKNVVFCRKNDVVLYIQIYVTMYIMYKYFMDQQIKYFCVVLKGL